MKANVIVTLKKEVLDPQGDAVRRALKSLGFDDLESVRVGKFIELEFQSSHAKDLKDRLEAMSTKLLCNPVIEDFHIEVDPKQGSSE
ncbi:MAG: phosphoribosylformylglycinamidine synthase subunit PurS [Myxococcales bacterium]|nr:MAG: phosphoribosylformylglycinamidine synthase subunit PurS [Myxococcales bacterium]